MNRVLLSLCLLVASASAQVSGNISIAGALNVSPVAGTNTSDNTIHYVSNAGSDANDGLSPATPWATVGKVNAAAPLLKPGGQYLFQRGGVWRDDYVKLANAVVAASGTSLTTNPPAYSGAPGNPVVIGDYGDPAQPNPLIDGSDRITATFTQYSGNVYVASVSQVPFKVYVDPPSAAVCANTTNGGANSVDCLGLEMQPNFIATDCTATQSCQLGDTFYNATNSHWKTYAWPSATPPAIGQSIVQAGQFFAPAIVGAQATWWTFWPNTINTGPQNVTLKGNGSVFISPYGGSAYAPSTPFTSTGGGANCLVAGNLISSGGLPKYLTYASNTGCTSLPTIVVGGSAGTNVSFYETPDPGSLYYDAANQKLYVQLQDGSNPNGHALYAAHRPYGILAQSVNWVTVRNVDVAHTLFTPINFRQYSDSTKGSSYFTNEYNTVVGSHVWNWGWVIGDGYQPQTPGSTYTPGQAAGIAFKGGGEATPHLQRGNRVTRSYVGTADFPTGNGNGADAGIVMRSQDGGGTANLFEVDGNIIRTYNAPGIDYGAESNQLTSCNNGGRVAYNSIFGGGEAIGFASVCGGRVDHNRIERGGGEGVQLGGLSTSSGNAAGVLPPALVSEVSGSTGGPPQIIDHNLINRMRNSPTSTGYNGLDCNSGNTYFSGGWFVNNTVNNVFASTFTIEGLNNGAVYNGHAINTYGGCTQYHALGNIFQAGAAGTNYNVFGMMPAQGGNVLNSESSMYWTYRENIQMPRDGQNNVWYNPHGGSTFRNVASCANWTSGSYDGTAETNSSCSDALFTNWQTDDLSLTSSSPAVNRNSSQVGVVGVGTADAGAVPYGSTVPQSVGAIATTYIP